MATPNRLPRCPRNYRNYLLRVLGDAGGTRYVVQDLRTGERAQLATEDDLRRFLAANTRSTGLR